MPRGLPVRGSSLVYDKQREAILTNFRLHMQMAASRQLRYGSGMADQAEILVPPAPPLDEIGTSLYNLFMPKTIRAALRDLSCPLEIETNDPNLPWELMCDDHGFLSLRFPLARSLPDKPFDPHITKPVADLRFLLISANPFGDLQYVHRETDDLAVRMNDLGVGCERLGKGRAVWNGVQTKLQQRHYDIVHFAGHVSFDSQRKDRCGLVLEDGDLFPLEHIESLLNGHPLVFINGCYSAREVESPRKWCGVAGEDAQGLASAFLQGGAWGFIGSQWFVSDELSYRFALQFYSHCLRGVTVAEALRATRESLRGEDERGFTWPAFVYFGDPTVRLVTPEANPHLQPVSANPTMPTAKPTPPTPSPRAVLPGSTVRRRPRLRWPLFAAIAFAVLVLALAGVAYATRPTIESCSPDHLRREENVWVRVEGQASHARLYRDSRAPRVRYYPGSGAPLEQPGNRRGSLRPTCRPGRILARRGAQKVDSTSDPGARCLHRCRAGAPHRQHGTDGPP